MVNEHAITFHDRLTPDQLDYVIRKANRLGSNGRAIVRVYMETDNEGTHLYFETQGPIKHDSATRN